MKLKRNKKDDSSRRGWTHFTIEDKNPTRIEAAENALREKQCPFTIGGEIVTWDNYCDGCPCYEDGYGSGFWILNDDVESFIAEWKIVKGSV